MNDKATIRIKIFKYPHAFDDMDSYIFMKRTYISWFWRFIVSDRDICMFCQHGIAIKRNTGNSHYILLPESTLGNCILSFSCVFIEISDIECDTYLSQILRVHPDQWRLIWYTSVGDSLSWGWLWKPMIGSSRKILVTPVMVMTENIFSIYILVSDIYWISISVTK